MPAMDSVVPGAPPVLVVAGKIATITLRRPSVANRLEVGDLAALREQVARVNAQAEVLVLRLAAQGRHFCSGFNIGQIDGGAAQAGAAFEALAAALETARPVTLAAIQGGVYGGAVDLALACDFRFGTAACEMQVPAARLGLLYYCGGLERFVSRLGLQTTKRLLLAADKLDAAAMQHCGYLDRLLPSAEALAHALDAYSMELSGMAPLALLGMKKHLNRIASGTLDAAEYAADSQAAAGSRDLREGALAWQAKRAPVFEGR